MFPFAKLINTNINDPLYEYNRFIDFMNTKIANSDWIELQAENPVGWPALNRGTPIQMDVVTGQEGTMYGTPWGFRSRWDASCFRALQHCFPDSSTFEYSKTNQLYCVYFINVNNQYNPFTALNRNGYQSLSTSTAASAVQINQFIYFDPIQKLMMQLNPFNKSSPTPYIF